MTNQENSSTICCPEFDPSLWDDKFFDWTEKKFIKEKVCTLFYMPIGFGRAMIRAGKKMEAVNATMPDNIGLSDHTSKWNMDIYLAVDRYIPMAENVTLSGRFYCKVYEGPFKDTGKWCDDYKAIATTKGFTVKKWYMWYTTCPKCAKKYGKNYVAIIGQVEPI